MESKEKDEDEIKELRKKNEAEFRVFLETDSIPGDSAFGNASHLFPHSQIAKSSIKSEIKTQIQMLPFPSVRYLLIIQFRIFSQIFLSFLHKEKSIIKH